MSTAQQVWLQKLGGAKNPVRQVQDDIMKDNLSQIQKSASKLNSTKVDATRQAEEKLTSEGPRPGERLVIVGSHIYFVMLLVYFYLLQLCFSFCCRFRQLKEQEERRKQQREEEKRRAEEAAANASKVYETHDKPVEAGNLVADDLVVEKSQAVPADTDPSTSGVVLNGNPSSKSLDKNQNSTSTPQTGNNEASAHVNVGINDQSQDKVLFLMSIGHLC